jgi:hypothetical protein
MTLEQLPYQLFEKVSNFPFFRICLKDRDRLLNSGKWQRTLSVIQPWIESRMLTVQLDFGHISEEDLGRAGECAAAIQELYDIGAHDIVVSAGCFPIMLEGYIGVEYITRFDKRFFLELSGHLSFGVTYSDYGALSPNWQPVENMRTGHANIRYTHDDYWLVLRQKGKDRESLYELTQLLVMQDEFRGAEFSWADNVWSQRSEREIGPGGPREHTSEHIHHHIAQVLSYG